MNKRHLKWYLLIAFLLWGLSATLVLIQHQAVQSQRVSLRVLAGEFENFRSSLATPQDDRMAQLSKLERGIVRISSALQVVNETNNNGLISSDLTQLGYLTDRFKNQAGDYISLQLNQRGLSVEIEHQAHHDKHSEALPLYHELGSFLFAAFYAREHSDDVDYLVLESLLTRSKLLTSPDKEKLQALLSLTSSVLAEQAQVTIILTGLLDSTIKNEVSRMDADYAQHESGLLYFSIFSGFFAFLVIFVTVLIGQTKKDQSLNNSSNIAPSDTTDPFELSVLQHNQSTRAREPTAQDHPVESQVAEKQISSDTNQAVAAVAPKVMPIKNKPDNKLDIDYMLETFDQDTESVVMVLDVFLADHQNDAEKIKTYFAKDRAMALRAAHSLKGVAGNLGAADLKSTALKLEKMLEECAELPLDLLAELENDLSHVVAEVLVYLKTVK